VVLKSFDILGASVKVCGVNSEKLLAEAIMSVEEDPVVIFRAGASLYEELNLVDVVSSFGSLRGGALVGLLVESSNVLNNGRRFNLRDAEMSSEGGLLGDVGVVGEEILEGSDGESGVLLVDLGEHDGVHADGLREGCVVILSVVADLVSDLLGELRARDEGQDVGVVRQVQHVLLGSLVVDGRSDSDNVVHGQVRELQLQSEHVPGLV
jgi:hypothetical protein